MMAYLLTAEATVQAAIGEAKVSPDPIEFDSIPAAIEAARGWLDSGPWPAKGAIKSATFKIEATP